MELLFMMLTTNLAETIARNNYVLTVMLITLIVMYIAVDFSVYLLCTICVWAWSMVKMESEHVQFFIRYKLEAFRTWWFIFSISVRAGDQSVSKDKTRMINYKFNVPQFIYQKNFFKLSRFMDTIGLFALWLKWVNQMSRFSWVKFRLLKAYTLR